MANENFIDPSEYVHAESTDRYGLRIQGSQMSPVLRDGWFVVVAPQKAPVVNEFVSIELRTGERLIRELLRQCDDSIVVIDVNGPRRTTIPTLEISHVHAICGFMGPSRWREAGFASEEAASLCP